MSVFLCPYRFCAHHQDSNTALYHLQHLSRHDPKNLPQAAFSFMESGLKTQHKNVSLHFLYILIFKCGHVFKSQGDYMHCDATVVGGLPNFLITKGQKTAGSCVRGQKSPRP